MDATVHYEERIRDHEPTGYIDPLKDPIRPKEPLPQTVLPNGKTACYARALLHQAEIAKGQYFTIIELLQMWSKLVYEDGALDEDNYVNKPDDVLQAGFNRLGLNKNVSYNLDPTDARGSIIKLTYEYPQNWAMSENNAHPYKNHYQSGSNIGQFLWDPWGNDLTKNYQKMEYGYVHY
jgi:hypothetical protein